MQRQILEEINRNLLVVSHEELLRHLALSRLSAADARKRRPQLSLVEAPASGPADDRLTGTAG
jgi:hypothetical protein